MIGDLLNVSLITTGRLDLEQEDNFGKLTVKDNGIGILSDRRKKIFERFERAVSSSKYEGLGVGLYITYQIVKAHGGAIEVKSKENTGTTFIVKLPLTQKRKQLSQPQIKAQQSPLTTN